MKRRPPAKRMTRREFLRTTGAGLAAASLLRAPALAKATPERSSIPPHRALEVPGVHAYPMEHSAGAIGSGWVLHCDERWADVLRNVLAHFGVAKAQA